MKNIIVSCKLMSTFYEMVIKNEEKEHMKFLLDLWFSEKLFAINGKKLCLFFKSEVSNQ